MTYECPICLSLNHASRPHCQNCGTIPARYSILGLPSRLIEHEEWTQFLQVVPAFGCYRASQHHARHLNLRTADV